MFPDLRTFIAQLRRDRDLVEIAAPVDANLEAAEIHRRVIAAGGPALLFTNVKGQVVSARHQPVRHRAPRRARVRRAAAAPDPRHRPSGRDDAAADAGQAVGRARPGGGADQGRHPPSAIGPGDRGRHPHARARRAAGADVLARGRRPVRHAAARLHHASRRQGLEPRHVPPARARRAHHRHALADRQGRRLSLPAGRSARPGLAGDGVRRRPAGADPLGDRAAAGERARDDAGVADRRASGCRRWPGPTGIRTRSSPRPSSR